MYSTLILMIIIFAPFPAMIKAMLTDKNPYHGVLHGIISGVIGVALAFLLFLILTGVTFSQSLESALDNIQAEDFMGPYQAMGIADDLDVEELQVVADSVKATMVRALPGYIIIWTSILAYVNYRIISTLLKKMGKEVSVLPPFRNLTLPRNSLFGFMIIFLLSFVAGRTGIVDSELIMINVELLLRFVFSVQGLAVLFFIGKIKKMPTILPVIVAAILIATGTGYTILFILGLAEVVFEIRKRYQKRLENSSPRL